MRTLWVSVLLAVLATVHSCTDADFARCASKLVSTYDLKIKDNAQVFPSLADAEEMDQFCRDYEDYQECLRPLMKDCEKLIGSTYDVIKAVLDGEDVAVEFACSPRGRQIYLDEGLSECFASPSLKEKTRMCNMDAEQAIMGDPCRLINRVVTCVTKAVLDDPMCGEAEARWTHDFNEKAITYLAQMIDCSITDPLVPREPDEEWESDEHRGSHEGGHHGSHEGGHHEGGHSGRGSHGRWGLHGSDSDSDSHSGSHEHSRYRSGKMHRGLIIGLGCGAALLLLVLLALGVFIWYQSSRNANRRTATTRAQPYLQKSPTVHTDGMSNPAYVISSSTEKSAPPPEYRSQVSLQGWVGVDPAIEEKQPLPESDFSQA